MEKLILNARRAIYHLDMKPGELGDIVMLVGDQGRVPIVSQYFDQIDYNGSNREFQWATGVLGGKKVSVVSTGIGADNVDIVMNELEAVANIDFTSHEPKKERKVLSFIRIGTCGTLQSSVAVGSRVVSRYAVGLDNTIRFYQGSDSLFDTTLSNALSSHLKWKNKWVIPYSSPCDETLLSSLFSSDKYLKGITVSAPGFYGPQGRASVIAPYSKDVNQRLSEFSFDGVQILNYEMEAAPIFAFSELLGHQPITVCLVLANRSTDDFLPDYKPHMDQLIQDVIAGIKAM